MKNIVEKQKKISILLCSFNGERFIKEQINSIRKQSYSNWHLFISDDGSTDNTVEIIQSIIKNSKKMSLLKGPKEGFAKNFAFVTSKKEVIADYYAWSDQDDIWLEHKFERALEKLKGVDPGIPAVYCSRTIITNIEGEELRLSKKQNKKPAFENALVESIAGGNTMIFNESARLLFNKSVRNLEITSHDWLMYILTTGVNGVLYYDNEPSIKYRQHDLNLIGSNNSINQMKKRLVLLFKGALKQNVFKNAAPLNNIRNELTEKNKKIYKKFYGGLLKNGISKIIILMKLRIRRQSIMETIALYFAMLFDKL